MSENVVFIQSHEPPLQDGRYNLRLTQTLNYESEIQSFKRSFGFQVTGPRFALNSDQLHSVFPPANSQGNYDNILPHAVFTRRTLPWERSVTPDNDQQSWLAIFVFEKTSAPAVVSGILSDLYPATTAEGDGTLPDGTWSYGSNTASGDAFLESGEAGSDQVTYFELDANTFVGFAPTLDDTSWIAHARTIENSRTGKESDFATVIANRIPVAGSNAVAHLVSLEGFGDQLPQDDGSFATAPSWGTIRLASLKSWTFAVNELEASFANTLQGLNGGIDANGVEMGDSQMRLPQGYIPAAATALPPTTAPFDSGYTVLSGADGETNANWYRGPLLPSTISIDASADWAIELLPASTPAVLSTNVNSTPDTDASYAVAWETGRMVSLASKSFPTELAKWKFAARMALNARVSRRGNLATANRGAYAQDMQSVLADPEQIKHWLGRVLTTTQHDDALSVPASLIDWMAELSTLGGIPAATLIPDSQMVPPESLRTFSIDGKWIAALLDGAWSVLRQPADQWGFDTAYQPWAQLQDGSLRHSETPHLITWPKSGVILNSKLVSGYWPGIKFNPGLGVHTLSTKQIGPNTLLLLFDAPVEKLTIHQPPETIHFGFEVDEFGTASKSLKYVGIDDVLYPSTEQSPPPLTGDDAPSGVSINAVPQRFGNVVKLNALAQSMVSALEVENADSFTSAEFALEMVEEIPGACFTFPTTDT